ncbi:unnamed protein product [Ceratitis capitata]|uniref:(Mediterranean fruit fly) hypothetical protein n=1 Tax=Ceratitis capitata TaxID=7213 RepID=A0A811U514_CERCA|nr:unnamed protein product [Ceratitis capitata]
MFLIAQRVNLGNASPICKTGCCLPNLCQFNFCAGCSPNSSSSSSSSLLRERAARTFCGCETHSFYPKAGWLAGMSCAGL